MVATAFAALSVPAVPALAATDTRLSAYALAPVGNIPQHGLDFGVGYTVAHVGPVKISPLVNVVSIGGNGTFHMGIAATVAAAKHVDIGLAEVQRPGSAGFTRIGTSVVLGVHL
jgi:hypothetical protein